MRRVTGVVQHYDWGDTRALPSVLGMRPDGRPWAEWWLGTHPGGPATVAGGLPLADLAGDLPYLLKLLAAAAPLSLQTHPSAAQAAAGFAREEAAGIPRDAPERVYRDRSAKPELLVAVTDFDALCGFRDTAESTALARELGAEELAATLEADGLVAALAGLYHGTVPAADVVGACAASRHPAATLVAELWQRYQGDPSVAVTLLLHHVRLHPGEAVYLTAGNLHAYLHGVGVELMESSDNVVRGGLTHKHVDVDELLSVVDPSPAPWPVLHAVEIERGCWTYPTPGAPFELRRFDVIGTLEHRARDHELLVCVTGDAEPLRQGQAVYLAPGEALALRGPATVFCAAPALDKESS